MRGLRRSARPGAAKAEETVVTVAPGEKAAVAPPRAKVSLLQSLRELRLLWGFVPKEKRRRAPLLLILMLAGAVAEALTLGAILPFLSLLTGEAPEPGTRMAAFAEFIGDPFPLRVVLLFALVVLTAGAIRLLLLWQSIIFILETGHALSVQLYKQVIGQNYEYHLANNTSQTLAGLQKVQQVTNAALLPFFHALAAALISTFIVVTLIVIDPVIALFSALCFGCIYFVLGLVSQSRLRRNSETVARLTIAGIQTTQEGMGGIREIILDNSQKHFVERFRSFDSEMMRCRAENGFIVSSPRLVLETFGMVLIAGLTLSMLSTGKEISTLLPVLGAMALGAQRLLPMVQQIYFAFGQILSNHQQIVDVRTMIAMMPDHDEAADLPDPLPFERSIRFDDVSFGYSAASANTLSDISLTIGKGERIGIVGPTGSGKSTFVNLLMGLLMPTGGGAIEIDGEALTADRRRAWQRNVSHVPQAIFLADATITQNIAFGMKDERIDMAAVREAARRASITEMIEGLEHGYDTVIGERGVRLSGGQRQRLGIARALYSSVPVIVLDEATSALDEETERTVMREIAMMDRKRTIVIIAHRLSTLADCDRIFRFEAGKLVAEGSYEDIVLH